MSKMKYFILLLAAAGLAYTAAAQEAAPPAAPAAGPISSRLSAAELARIKSGEIILRSSTDEGSQSGKGYAVGLIKAAPQAIWGTILDYDKYAEFMTRVASCKRTLMQGSRIDADFVLDMGLADVRYSIIHTLHPDANRLTWVLDESKPRDYITKTTGYWQLEPLAEGCGGAPCTLVEYSVEVDVSIPLIGALVRGLVKKLTRDDLPNVIGTLKKRVESGNTWKRK